MRSIAKEPKLKLKPCPFCGSEDVVIAVNTPRREDAPPYFIWCVACGVQSANFREKTIASEWWNTRIEYVGEITK